MNKRYLFFVSLPYSYSILRPLQEEIWRRGNETAWFIEEPCEDCLEKNERRLRTIQEVMDYNPVAVFAPGNWVYDFFPGIKVQVFHGYAMKKRIEKIDDHFTIRDWFDIYCTQGPSSTPYFKELEKKYGYFKIYETGWCKVDPFFEKVKITAKDRPMILYSPTFSRKITSAPYLLETITQLIKTKPWDWTITFHPKLDNPELVQQYKQLAETHNNVVFCSNDGLNTFRKIDVLLCDSSSIIVEVMLLEKPVVTFRNTHPGNFLINVLQEEEVGDAIEKALTRPAGLMENIRAYTAHHEAHRDGQNSARVLDAVDDFILNCKGRIKKKPLNLFRKIKLRLKIKYYKL
jgi:CDP-glycerol glycerophosphotransferase (TagB/SpsB family)